MEHKGNTHVMQLAPGQWAGHMRIYHRECLALANAGYQVSLVAHPLQNESLDQRIKFHPLSTFGEDSLNWKLLDRYRRSERAFRLARGSNAALYQYYSPEFISWGARLSKEDRRPVIFDCMEDFEAYVYLREGIPTFLRPIAAYFVRRQLQKAGRWCSAIITADQGTANRLKPISKNIVVIHNFPDLNYFPCDDAHRPEPIFDLIYHGSLYRHTLEVCLQVDRELVARGRRLSWRFVGQIPEMGWFTGELARRKIEDRFSIKPLVPHQMVYKEISAGKIGIIPLPDYEKYRTNIPQKLFEFMAMKIPVVLSDLPASQPFYGDYLISVPPDEYGAYAEAIIALLDNPARRREMGEQGRRMVGQEYNWQRESAKLLNLYADLLKGN